MAQIKEFNFKSAKVLRSKSHELPEETLFQVRLQRSSSMTLIPFEALSEKNLERVKLSIYEPTLLCHIWRTFKLFCQKLFKWFKIAMYFMMILTSAFTFARRAGRLVEGAINNPIVNLFTVFTSAGPIFNFLKGILAIFTNTGTILDYLAVVAPFFGNVAVVCVLVCTNAWKIFSRVKKAKKVYKTVKKMKTEGVGATVVELAAQAIPEVIQDTHLHSTIKPILTAVASSASVVKTIEDCKQNGVTVAVTNLATETLPVVLTDKEVGKGIKPLLDVVGNASKTFQQIDTVVSLKTHGLRRTIHNVITTRLKPECMDFELETKFKTVLQTLENDLDSPNLCRDVNNKDLRAQVKSLIEDQLKPLIDGTPAAKNIESALEEITKLIDVADIADKFRADVKNLHDEIRR